MEDILDGQISVEANEELEKDFDVPMNSGGDENQDACDGTIIPEDKQKQTNCCLRGLKGKNNNDFTCFTIYYLIFSSDIRLVVVYFS